MPNNDWHGRRDEAIDEIHERNLENEIGPVQVLTCMVLLGIAVWLWSLVY